MWKTRCPRRSFRVESKGPRRCKFTSQGKVFPSVLSVRQPRSATRESDTNMCAPGVYGVIARPARTGFGGRRTSCVWGRGLDHLNGRSYKSSFAVWSYARPALDRGRVIARARLRCASRFIFLQVRFRSLGKSYGGIILRRCFPALLPQSPFPAAANLHQPHHLHWQSPHSQRNPEGTNFHPLRRSLHTRTPAPRRSAALDNTILSRVE